LRFTQMQIRWGSPKILLISDWTSAVACSSRAEAGSSDDSENVENELARAARAHDRQDFAGTDSHTDVVHQFQPANTTA
jgi:hypothetical protein